MKYIYLGILGVEPDTPPLNVKGKGKIHPRTGHEGSERE
jgi:hypothetical protein